VVAEGVLEIEHDMVAGLLRKQRRSRRRDDQTICGASRVPGFMSASYEAAMAAIGPRL